MNIKNVFYYLKCLPNTAKFNFYYFTIRQAIHFPVIVSYKVHLENLGSKNSVTIKNVTKGMIKIGVCEGAFSLAKNEKSWWNIEEDGSVEFLGKANFSAGVNIEVSKGGKIVFGNDFFCNANCVISSQTKIEFGSNVLMGWNCTVIDGDGHQIWDYNKNILNQSKPIYIDNNVWLSAHTSVLKGTTIAEGCVVSYGSLIIGNHMDKNCIISGMPIKIIKKDILWRYEK